ncbi:hypothetical protein [Salinactinospora qingdaonensis]
MSSVLRSEVIGAGQHENAAPAVARVRRSWRVLGQPAAMSGEGELSR